MKSYTFEEFWTHLRREAKGVKIDILFKAGWLEMQWSFRAQETKLKIIKLLKQRGVKYREDHSSVYFWIRVDRHGRLEFVKA